MSKLMLPGTQQSGDNNNSSASTALAVRGGSLSAVTKPPSNSTPQAPISLINPKVSAKLEEQERIEREIREAKELAEKQAVLEVEIKKVITELSRNTTLRVMVALDYTASTIYDVATFRDSTSSLIQLLSSEFKSVDFIPSIARGGHLGIDVELDVEVGSKNNFGVFHNGNFEYNAQSPPFKGIERSISKYPKFLTASEDVITAAVVFGDSYPELPNPSAINDLVANQTYVAAIVSGEGYINYWTNFVLTTFAENGVVIGRDNANMDVVKLIVEALKHRRDNLYRARADAIVKARMGTALVVAGKSVAAAPAMSLAAKLNSLRSGNAGNILEGTPRKQIT